MIDDFIYYVRRCLPAIIIILLLFFPIRRFLREKGFFVFGNKTIKEALLWAHQDSIRVADSLKRIKIKTKAVEEMLQDSLVKSDKEKHPEFARDIRVTYYIIVGSFTNPENAKLTAGKYHRLGYKTSIINMTNRNGIKTELVSVNIFNNLNEATRYLREFKIKFDPEAWIFSKK
ncbi:MAG: SPOR domain-containing protein [Bacteroidales bacterium]|jgi:hypothetical protein